MTAPFVQGCWHHDYFRFMTRVDQFDSRPSAPRRPACIACDNGISDDHARHLLEQAYEIGTAVPAGVSR